jgi:type I restriction enzyme S subunit
VRVTSYWRYKVSGIEWLGKIPAHWDVKPLKHVTECLDGQRVPVNAEERARMQGEYPYWGANGVLDHVDGWLFDEPLVLLGEDGAPFFEPHKPVSFFVDGRLWVNNHAHVLRPRSSTVPKFLVHALNTVDYRAFIGGTTRDKLTQDYMRAIPVQLPSLGEQLAIADFLDHETAKIDVLVKKKERLIELLQEKRTALITHAVTKGLDPNVPMKDSGIEWLGQIPAHWDVKRIRHLAHLRRGASPRPIDDPIYFDDVGEYAWVRIGDLTASERYLEQTTQRLSELGQSKSVCLEPGELFVSIAATVGKPIITRVKCCIHDGFVSFDDLTTDVEFLWYLLQCGEAYKGLGKLGTQLNLNTETVGGISVPVPARPEQEGIVRFLDLETAKIDALIAKVREAIERLKEYRTALISAAVTGKIDVRGV